MSGKLGALFGAAALTAMSVGVQAATEYEYDDAGRLIRTYTDSGQQVDYSLDEAGNREQISITTDTRSKVAFSASSTSVSETAGSVTLTVQRTGDLGSIASVLCATESGTGGSGAVEGTDFTDPLQTLTWPSGNAATKYCTVPITNDTAIEDDETFFVRLSDESGTALGSPLSVVVTITDDDAAQQDAELSFTTSSMNVGEPFSSSSSYRTVTISVKREGGTSGAVSVDYATRSGTASPGSDYSTPSGTLNWSSGDSANKSFTVLIYNDSAPELDETFYIDLSNPSSGAVLGSSDELQITIRCNDGGSCQ